MLIFRRWANETVKSLWADDMMEFPAELRSVVTLADAKRVEAQLKEELFSRQIAMADLVIINKIVDS